MIYDYGNSGGLHYHTGGWWGIYPPWNPYYPQPYYPTAPCPCQQVCPCCGKPLRWNWQPYLTSTNVTLSDVKPECGCDVEATP